MISGHKSIKLRCAILLPLMTFLYAGQENIRGVKQDSWQDRREPMQINPERCESINPDLFSPTTSRLDRKQQTYPQTPFCAGEYIPCESAAEATSNHILYLTYPVTPDTNNSSLLEYFFPLHAFSSLLNIKHGLKNNNGYFLTSLLLLNYFNIMPLNILNLMIVMFAELLLIITNNSQKIVKMQGHNLNIGMSDEKSNKLQKINIISLFAKILYIIFLSIYICQIQFNLSTPLYWAISLILLIMINELSVNRNFNILLPDIKDVVLKLLQTTAFLFVITKLPLFAAYYINIKFGFVICLLILILAITTAVRYEETIAKKYQILAQEDSEYCAQ